MVAMPATTRSATYASKKGFLCDDHVLYCPNLSGVDNTKPFYLYCAKHDVMYEIDLSKQAPKFIAEFPHGCKAT